MKRESNGRHVDWRRVYQRLEALASASERPFELSPDQAQAVLDERARALAGSVVEATDPHGLLEVLCFSVGAERYALELKWVYEVTGLVDITPLPFAPEFIAGLANLHGEVLAVGDLRTLFLPRAPLQRTKLSRLVVLGDAQGADVGLLADSIHTTHTIASAELAAHVNFARGAAREYLLGVTRDALVVLDGAALLADERLFATAEASRS